MYDANENAKLVGQLRGAATAAREAPQVDRALSMQEEANQRLSTALHRLRDLGARLGTTPRVPTGNLSRDTPPPPLPAGHVHRAHALANGAHSLLSDIEGELEQIETLV